MKITSPIFLQQAGRAGKTPFAGIKVLFPYANPIIGGVSGNGDITVTSVKNGEKISNTYSNPHELIVSVQADANTWITISGDIKDFYTQETGGDLVKKIIVSGNNNINNINCNENYLLEYANISGNALNQVEFNDSVRAKKIVINSPTLKGYNQENSNITDLDLSKCPDLKGVTFSGCGQLKSINLSNNAALNSINIDNCDKLEVLDLSKSTSLSNFTKGNNSSLRIIKFRATTEDPSIEIREIIFNNALLNGVVYLNPEDEFYSTIADAATAAGWTIAQL